MLLRHALKGVDVVTLPNSFVTSDSLTKFWTLLLES